MSMPFTLSVPADARFRGLVADVTAKCAELSGGTAADGQALADALAKTLSTLATDPHAQFHLAFAPARGGVEVRATCAGHSVVVHHAIPVSRP